MVPTFSYNLAENDNQDKGGAVWLDLIREKDPDVIERLYRRAAHDGAISMADALLREIDWDMNRGVRGSWYSFRDIVRRVRREELQYHAVDEELAQK